MNDPSAPLGTGGISPLATICVLVVEDFEPFRQFIHTTLQGSELLIVGEVSDGLETVQRAEELNPI
jgi:CheY-like chemotaxis protein